MLNYVTYVKIYEKIENEQLSFEELLKELDVDMDELLEGMRVLVCYDVVLHNMGYLLEDKAPLSEAQRNLLERIKKASEKNLERREERISYEKEQSNEEYWEMIDDFNDYCEQNVQDLIAVSLRNVTVSTMVDCYEGRFTRKEIIALAKKAVVEGHVKTDMTRSLEEAVDEEERKELLLIQQLSDQIPAPVLPEVKYVPIEEELAAGNLEGVCGCYVEYVDPMFGEEVQKCLHLKTLEHICDAFMIYSPDPNADEVCAGIYLYLLGQGCEHIQNIRFFSSPYDALEFYIQHKDDTTIYYDASILPEDKE